MIDPRLAVLRDWLDVQMDPAPDIDDILRRLDDQELRAGLDTGLPLHSDSRGRLRVPISDFARLATLLH